MTVPDDSIVVCNRKFELLYVPFGRMKCMACALLTSFRAFPVYPTNRHFWFLQGIVFTILSWLYPPSLVAHASESKFDRSEFIKYNLSYCAVHASE